MTTKVKTKPDDPVLDVAQAATYLGQTERWVRRSVEERRFKFARLGRRLAFRRSWLDEYVEQQTVAPE